MEAHDTDTQVTTVPRICPICLSLIKTDAPTADVLEFADFPGVTYHVRCAEQVGIERVRAILSEHWPPPPPASEIPDETPEDAADELTEAFDAANDHAVRVENDDDAAE